MPKRFLTGLALAFSVAAAAAAQTPKPGGIANVIIQPEPPGLMVAMVQNGPTQMVAGNIYEGLLRYNAKLEPQPGLAESWSVGGEGKVYTFKLKPGVTWHDGKPFSAADVLFTVEFIKQTNPRCARQPCDGRERYGAGRLHRRLHAEAALRPVPRHFRGGFDADGAQAHL